MKKEERIINALGEVDEKFILESAPVNTTKKKKPLWIKWGAMAACLSVVAALSIGLLQGGMFGNQSDKATLNNGDEIVFKQVDTLGGSFTLAFEVTAKPLTNDETTDIFGDLPITAHAVFMNRDIDAGIPQELIGFEGKIGNVKAIISTSDVPLLDTEIVGTEETAKINGTSIIAGYFITDPNSKGEQNAIYYAAFELSKCKVYLENAGTKDDRETTKNQLAEVLQKLIENGEPDLSFLDNEV